jgi:hypothetical protein
MFDFRDKICALADQPVVALQLSGIPDRRPLTSEIGDKRSNDARVKITAFGK